MARPLIGITGPGRGAWGQRACVHAAVRWCGGTARHLRPGDSSDTAALDGVIVTGGHDIEPTLYKAAAEVEGRYDPERDAFEAAVIDNALRNRTPLFGICRGAQLLNVRLGGSLFQDLRAQRRLTSSRRTMLPLKTLYVLQDTLLAELFGRPTVKINSLHQQSIDRLGVGLRICGRDPDNIVQAVEVPGNRCVLGVQWHPEFLLYASLQRRLFTWLVDAACAHRTARVTGNDED